MPALTPIGPEFSIMDNNGYQRFLAVAADQDGDFVVVCEGNGEDSNGIYAQRFDNQGARQGSRILVNTFTSFPQALPAVAMDASGNFVVAWQSRDQDGSSEGIFAQRFSATGSPVGGEFLVNTFTTGFQGRPGVAMDASGDFVIAWDSTGQDGPTPYIYAQRFAGNGARLGGEIRVSELTTPGYSPSLAMDRAGAFIVAWNTSARRYSADGVPGTQFSVSTEPGSRGAHVAMDADGDFVLAWNVHSDIMARRYDANETPQGTELLVTPDTIAILGDPSVAMNASGDFVVAWTYDAGLGTNHDIYARQFSANDGSQGPQVRCNTYTTDQQVIPAVAMDAAGNTIVAWQSRYQASIYGGYAQRYASALPPRVNIVRVNDGAMQRSRVTDLHISFTSNVLFAGQAADAFVLTRNGSGAAVTFTASASIVDGVTVVRLDIFGGPATQYGSLTDGRYTLTVLSNQVSGSGQFLDGNGDGTGGDSYTFGDAQGLFRFYGDVNGDRRVDISDFGFFSLGYFQAANYIAALDFNNDGRIDIADFGQFSVRYFTMLP